MGNRKTLIFVVANICAFAFVAFSAYFVKGMTKRGIVSGILYNIDDSLGESTAIIYCQIVREGDMIYCVKVIKIERFTVKFKKGNCCWKQKVRERPNPAWEE